MKRIISIILIPVLLLTLSLSISVPTAAGTRIPENVMLSVDGAEAGCVRAINASYINNTYISLIDTAVLFAGSGKPFKVEVTQGGASITTGEPYTDEHTHSGFEPERLEQYGGQDPVSMIIRLNEEERKYFMIISDVGGYYDCFISPMDLAMMLDINMDIDEAGNISADTSGGFDINPARMEGYGFFDGFNTVVAGDATTGEIFYGYNMEEPNPIASTTKLMTFLLTMDAMSSGSITAEDTVPVSKEAANLSASENGAIGLKEGWEIPVSDLILGALLPSSNECALTLAEHVSGSESDFVVKMNEKSAELGLNSAEFYNSNGLPVYTDTVIPAKKQNKMNGYDMFRMCSHILNTYPQIKEITSLKTAKMQSIGADLKNTNALLYNMPEINGLKTGTTDKSGACLVTSLTVEAQDGPHDLVVVALGAENSQARLRVSELMARYSKNVLFGKAAKISYSVNGGEEEETVTSESIIRTVVEYALRK